MKGNRIHGLMVGITIGFAFWGRAQAGAVKNAPVPVKETWESFAFSESEDPNMGIMQAAAETKKEPVQLYAQSAVLMDGDNGRILYEKEGDVFRSMASTTKIMTCILALEKGKPPLITGEDGRKTVELITAIYKSGFSGRRVKLPISCEDEYYGLDGILRNAVHFYEKKTSVENFAEERITVGSY